MYHSQRIEFFRVPVVHLNQSAKHICSSFCFQIIRKYFYAFYLLKFIFNIPTIITGEQANNSRLLFGQRFIYSFYVHFFEDRKYHSCKMQCVGKMLPLFIFHAVIGLRVRRSVWTSFYVALQQVQHSFISDFIQRGAAPELNRPSLSKDLPNTALMRRFRLLNQQHLLGGRETGRLDAVDIHTCRKIRGVERDGLVPSP